MPGSDEQSSVIELESLAQEAVSEHSKTERLERPAKAASKVRSSHTVKKKHAPHDRLSLLRDAHQKRIHALTKRYKAQIKQIRKKMKDNEKSNKKQLALRIAEVERQYHAQLEQARVDYNSQNMALRTDVKDFLEAQILQLTQNYESVSKSNSSQELEEFRRWLHEELLSAMQEKAKELEDVKSASDAQLNKMVLQIDKKNREIRFLESKIEEMSDYLPKDIRRELFEELGIEEQEEETKPENKRWKIGFLSKLTSLF